MKLEPETPERENVLRRSPDKRRRTFVYGGLAAAATAAGGVFGWMKLRPHEFMPSDETGEFWRMSFETPAGGTLTTASLRGKPLLLNFWATWCPPCVEELPLIDAFFKQQAIKGWQVLGLAIDQPLPVQRFLAKAPVRFPIGLASSDGTALSKSLGNLAGGLPFTVVFAPNGSIRQRRIGRLTENELDHWAGIK